MRKNIFELMQGNEIDLYTEYLRIYRVFERTEFECESSIKIFIGENYFLNWKHRKRYISINDLLDSLEISRSDMSQDNISTDKLLLYTELVFNLINLIEEYALSYDGRNIVKSLRNNIADLLEDMNYEIKTNTREQFVIIEKDKLTTAVAEKFPDITDTVIEYRRFVLKGNIEAKRKILDNLANKVEPLRKTLKNTPYTNIIEDINMMLNNLNIRHNNIEGPKKQEYTVNMPDNELEKWYDTTYDMILSALMIKDYNDKKEAIKELKSHY